MKISREQEKKMNILLSREEKAGQRDEISLSFMHKGSLINIWKLPADIIENNPSVISALQNAFYWGTRIQREAIQDAAFNTSNIRLDIDFYTQYEKIKKVSKNHKRKK